MKYKSKLCFLSTFLALAIILSVFSITISAKNIKSNDFKYLMIQENNSLFIYNTSNLNNPLYNIDFNIKLLPEKDQNSLTSGLYIQDENELKRILEDFMV